MVARSIASTLLIGVLLTAVGCAGATPSPTAAPTAPPTPAPTAPPTPAPSPTPSPAELFVDDFLRMWNDLDGQAARDVYATNAVVLASTATGQSEEQARGIDAIVAMVEGSPLTITRTGAVDSASNLFWYPVRIARTNDPVQASLAVVVLYAPGGKVAQHWVIWDRP